MEIRHRLQKIFYEHVELSEEERFSTAIQKELEEEYNNLLSSTPKTDQNTPEQELEAFTDTLKELAISPLDKETVPVIINMTISKAKEGLSTEHILKFLKTKFKIDAELEGQLSTILKKLTDVNPLVEEAQQMVQDILPKLVLVFKPSCGMNSPEFVDRSKDHLMKYIDRINGKKVEINQALKEMKALFTLDSDLEKQVESIFQKSITPIVETQNPPQSSPSTNDAPATTGSPSTNDSEIPTETPMEEENGKAGFYVEYRNLFEDVDNIAERIVEKEGLKEENNDAFGYTHLRETIAEASSVAMRYGANKYPKTVCLEDIEKIINEEFNIKDQELVEELKNTIRHAYEIGENYSQDFLKNSDLHNECKSIDMTISMNEIVDIFAEKENEEELVEIEKVDDIIEEPITEKDAYREKLNRLFSDD